MPSLIATVKAVAQATAEGQMLSPREFLHLGSRAAVDQAFSRLTAKGLLLRVGQGLYTRPVDGRFGPRPPSADDLVSSFASMRRESVAPGGAAEANALGLTTQVPVREIYWTTGKTRQLRLGRRTIELRHAPLWKMSYGRRPAGRALRALAWLGPAHAEQALTRLRQELPVEDWQLLYTGRSSMPSWLARAIGKAGGLA